MEPEPKRTKLENCSPVANVKDKPFVDLTGSPELASCSKEYGTSKHTSKHAVVGEDVQLVDGLEDQS